MIECNLVIGHRSNVEPETIELRGFDKDIVSQNVSVEKAYSDGDAGH